MPNASGESACSTPNLAPRPHGEGCQNLGAKQERQNSTIPLAQVTPPSATAASAERPAQRAADRATPRRRANTGSSSDRQPGQVAPTGPSRSEAPESYAAFSPWATHGAERENISISDFTPPAEKARAETRYGSKARREAARGRTQLPSFGLWRPFKGSDRRPSPSTPRKGSRMPSAQPLSRPWTRSLLEYTHSPPLTLGKITAPSPMCPVPPSWGTTGSPHGFL